MACVLRATGKEFQVVEYLHNSLFKPVNVFTIGERKSASTVWDTSGITVGVSDGEAFAIQVGDAIEFIKTNRDELRHLNEFPGVEGFELDFGVNGKDGFLQSYVLPLELISLASEVSLEMEISIYAP